MNRRLALAAVAGAAVLVLVTLLVLSGGGSDDGRTSGVGADATAGVDPFADPMEIETVEVLLYFPGAGNELYREPRAVAASDDSPTLAATLVQALIAGPGDELLAPVLNPETAVGSILISAEGVAFVDLRSASRPTPPVTGSTQELLTLQSLVHTLVHNVAEIESIVVLWNGRQPQTFGGHIDTTHPLLPDPELLAS